MQVGALLTQGTYTAPEMLPAKLVRQDGLGGMRGSLFPFFRQ